MLPSLPQASDCDMDMMVEKGSHAVLGTEEKVYSCFHHSSAVRPAWPLALYHIRQECISILSLLLLMGAQVHTPMQALTFQCSP